MAISSQQLASASKQMPSIPSTSLVDDLKDLQCSHQSSFIALGHHAGSSTSSPGLRYDSTSLIILAKGSLEEDGGFDGLCQILFSFQNEVQFIFLKFCAKIVLVQLVSEFTSAVQRARSMVFGRSLAAQMPVSNHLDNKVNMVTINDISQLTDSFLRAQLVLGSSNAPSSFIPRSFTQSSISSFQAAESSKGSPSVNGHTPPDVPISVSSATLHSSPFPQSNSLSTIDTSSSNSHATHLSFTGLPAVGLGIGGFGRSAISPFRETFEGVSDAYDGMMLGVEDDHKRESDNTVLPFAKLNEPNGFPSSPMNEIGGEQMKTESTIGGDSESGLEDSLHPQFPDPPKRNSQLSNLGLPLQKGEGRLSTSMSTTSGLIDSYQDRYSLERQRSKMKESGSDSLFTLSKTSFGDLDFGIDSGHFSRNAIHTRSIRHAPSLPSMLNSISDGSSALGVGSGGVNHGGERTPQELNYKSGSGHKVRQKSISNRNRQNRPASFSASSVMTHESVFAELQNARDLVFVDQNDSYSFEELERERLDFLRWKEEQERMILAKEKQRERQRRLIDEAKREKVMKKLLIEQGLLDQIATTSIAIDDEKENKVDGKQHAKVIRPTKSKSTLSTNSQSDECKVETKSGTSTKARSKRSFTTGTRSTQSPLHPPPPLPLPKSPTEQKKKASLGSMDDIAAIYARHTKTQSEEVYDGVESLKKSIQDLKSITFPNESDPNSRSTRDKTSRQQITPPLAGSVKAAIEREMRRPVITLEGHVRPRVRQMRAHNYGDHNQSSVDALQPSLSADGSDDIAKSPLIKSMMEAQQKRQLSGQSTQSHRSSDHSDAFIENAEDTGLSFVSPITPVSPALIKIVDPDGKHVGSGWALSEVKGMQVGSPVDKELPVLPVTSNRRTMGSPTPSLLHLSEMVGFTIDTPEEEKKPISEKLSSKRGTLSDASEIDIAATHDAEEQRAPNPSGISTTSSFELLDEKAKKIQSSPTLTEGSEERQGTFSSSHAHSSSMNTYTTDTALTQTSSMTLIDQIFRSKLSEPQKKSLTGEDAQSKEKAGLTNDQFSAILARQNQLDNLLSDLQRKRTITKEVEASARARWARQQVERQRLNAYERSMLESEERLRRARTDDLSMKEEEKQRQLEDEQAEVEKRIIEEEERRKILIRQKEIRNEKLRVAKEMQLQLHQEIKGMQQSRQQRRLQLHQEFKEKIDSKDCLLKGSLTIQFGSVQGFRRSLFELYNDRLSLFDESKNDQSKKLIETIKITKGSILKLSEAFEEVQMPHAFSLHLASDVQSGFLSGLKEPIIAFTDNELSKEQLMAGLAVLSGLEAK